MSYRYSPANNYSNTYPGPPQSQPQSQQHPIVQSPYPINYVSQPNQIPHYGTSVNPPTNLNPEKQNLNTTVTSLLSSTYYSDKKRVQTDVQTVLVQYSTLKLSLYPPKPTILYLQGTIPIVYQKKQFHIPLHIILPENYPLSPPNVIIKPTENMIINVNRFCDASGIVYHPYLSNWKSIDSLIILISHLIKEFSEIPPCVARPPPQSQSQVYPNQNSYPPAQMSFHIPQRVPTQPQPQYQSYPQVQPPPYQSVPQTHPNQVSQYYASPQVQMNPSTNPSQRSVQVPSSQYYGALPPQYSQSATHTQVKSQSQPTMYNTTPMPPHVQYQPQPYSLSQSQPVQPIDLRSQLFNKIKVDYLKYKKANDEQCDFIHNEERRLTSDYSRFQQILNNELMIRDKIMEEIEVLKGKVASTEAEIERRSEELSRQEIDIDKYTDSPNPTTKLIQEWESEIAAIDDVFYELSKSLEEETICLEDYLKNIRKYSKQQFFLVASINKIRSNPL